MYIQACIVRTVHLKNPHIYYCGSNISVEVSILTDDTVSSVYLYEQYGSIISSAYSIVAVFTSYSHQPYAHSCHDLAVS